MGDSKAGRAAMRRAISTERCQSSSTVRPVGTAGQLKLCLVVCGLEMHWAQMSVSEMVITIR